MSTGTATPVVLGRYEKPGNLSGIASLAANGQIAIRPNELIRTTDGRVYHWTTSALEIVSAPVHHGTVANVEALDGIHLLPSCTRGVHPGDTAYVTAAGCEYRVTSGVNATAGWAACATIPTAPAEIGADPAGTAAAAVSTHNTATDSHADIRTLVADRVPISSTRLGSVGNTPLTTTALSAADWAALPVGWRGIISAEAALASGLPAADVYHLQKVSNRDVSGGAAYQAQGYLSPTLYVGVAATSSDLPTWSVALTSAPGTTVSAVGASLLSVETPGAPKIAQINPDGSATLVDVPSGGGGGVAWTSVGSTSAPAGGAYLYAATAHTMYIDDLAPGVAGAVVVIHHESSLEVQLSGDIVALVGAAGATTVRRRADGSTRVSTVPAALAMPSFLRTTWGLNLDVDLDCFALAAADATVMSSIPAASGSSWPVTAGSPVASTTGGRRGIYFGSTGSAGGVVIPTLSYTVALVASWDGVSGYARSLNGAGSNWLLGPYSGAWQLYGGGFTSLRSAVSGALMVIVLSRTESATTIRYLAADGTTIASATAPSGSMPGALYVGTGGVYADPAHSHIHQIGVWSRALSSAELDAVAGALRDRWS